VPLNLKKKQSAKQKSAKKQAQKTRKFQLKQAKKQATLKFSKKNAIPQKNKPKFAGKPQRWQQ